MIRALRLSGLLLAVLVLPSCNQPGTESADFPIALAIDSVPFEGPTASGEFAPTLEGPARPVALAPSGTLYELAPGLSVSVTFSTPMVPLTPGGVEAPGAIRLDPEWPGSTMWQGTRTLIFTPSDPFPLATGFQVTVDPTLTDAENRALAGPVSWSFETPRPRVVGTTPGHFDRNVDPTTPLYVRFSQAIQTNRVAEFLVLRPEGGARVDIQVAAAGDSAVVIRPAATLRQDTQYELVVDMGVPPVGGTLGTESTEIRSFRTYGPLTWNPIYQPRPWWEEPSELFEPDRGVQLEFSSPVGLQQILSVLTVEPEVEWPASLLEREDYESESHTLPAVWAPNTAYRLSLTGLTDVFGQTLTSSIQTFATGPLRPSFAMPQGVLFIERLQMAGVPLRITNLDEVELGVEPITTGQQLVEKIRAYDPFRWYGPLPDDAPEPSAVEATEPVGFNVPADRPAAPVLDLSSYLQDGAGIIGLRVKSAVGSDGSPGPATFEALAVVTDLGVTAKFAPHESLVMVSRLSDASVVPGAEVSLLDAMGKVWWSGQTSEDGTVKVPGWAALGLEQPSQWDRPTQFIIVREGNDWSFASNVLGEGLEPYRFGMSYSWYPEPETVAGSVFSDRGLYRAGDEVFLKGILRSRTSGEWTSVRDSIRVLVDSPRDERVLDRLMVPSALGTFDLSWRAPADAALGQYQVRIAYASDSLASSREPWERGDLADGTFRVDAFRTATFAVEAGTSSSSYSAGDVFEGRIDARYLFGAALGDAPARVELSTRPTSFSPPGLDGFRFDASWSNWNAPGSLYRTLLLADTLLDSQGSLRRSVQLPGNARGAATELIWEASVESPDYQQLSGRTSITLHPGTFYIGLRPSTGYVDARTDGEVFVDVVSVKPSGASEGPREIEVSLVRREWNSVREIGVDGRTRWRSEVVEDVLAKSTVETEAGSMKRVGFDVSQGGLYLLRGESFDERGNRVRSEAAFYASGGGYVGWQRRDDDLLELVADRESYAPGETARIMIQSPFESATALVTVERDGVMDSFVRTVEGSAPSISISLEERHLPNVYVGVILLNGRSAAPAAGGDVGAPAFRAGYVALPVDPGSRHLSVRVSPAADTLRPGARLRVDLQLLDSRGRGTAGEIAFSAADAGVIDLIGYRLPDPFNAFYADRPLKVNTSETRANLVKQRSFGQKEEDMGGGGGDPDSQLRRDFRPLAHWDPRVETDDNGRATIEFTLPESLSLFRLMATAVGAENRFGNGESTVVTSQPLVIQPALPRFARAGDRFDAAALVTNRTSQSGDAELEFSATGFEADGASSSNGPVSKGDTERFSFGGRVAPGDSLVFRISGRLGEEQDGFELAIPVMPTATRIRNGQFASTDGKLVIPLAMPESVLPNRGGVNVRLASTALIGLDGAIEYLFDYPYGCLEQRTSRVRPLIVAGPILEDFNLDALGGDREAVIQNWMAELENFWTGSGYSLWPGSVYNHPYVTAYVLNTMADAVTYGVGVRRSNLDAAADAVEATVRRASDHPTWMSSEVWNDTRAFMLLGLARSGRVLEAEISALANRMLTDPRASTDGLSYLARTIDASDAGPLEPLMDRLLTAIEGRVRMEAEEAYVVEPSGSAYAWIFASQTRSTALAVSALSLQPERENARTITEAMIRRLLADRQTGRWASTQDNAAVVDAFAAYRDGFESTDPDFEARVELAGREILNHTFSGPSLSTAETSVAPSDISSGDALGISMEGSGRVFASVMVDAWTNEPLPAASSGLRVTRTYQPLNPSGAPLGTERPSTTGTINLAAGDQVLVTLRLVSQSDRHYIVVDDPLPAGLEPVNTAFENSDESLYEVTGSDRWWGSFNHTEQRDDRVLLFADYLGSGEHVYRYAARATTSGDFAWPAVQSEAMYRPSIFARTTGSRLVVASRTDGVASR